MFKVLQAFLSANPNRDGSASTAPQIDGLDQSQGMALALMVEIALADHDVDNRERAAIMQHLQNEFGLSEAQAEQAFEQAYELAKDATSLHDFTQHAKQEDYDTRLNLFKGLWQTAYADQSLDPHEEAMLRKIADLLYISHADFIRLKLAVVDATSD